MSAGRKNPFPGLRPFEYDEYELFFGREEQYEEMIGKLTETRFLAVVGTSGSGKSSLVKAGLLPALYGGQMTSAGPNWRIAEFRPKDDPIRELALALSHKRVFGDRSKENGSSLFKLTESTHWFGLCSRVNREAQEKERNPSGRILEVLGSEKGLMITGVSRDEYLKDRSKIVQLFNEVLQRRDFYQVADFQGVPLSKDAGKLLARDQKSLTDEEIEKLNRLLLEAAFPQEITKKIESQAQVAEVSLRRGDLGLIEVAREAKMADGENLLVVVDQFEELFRYAKISEHGPHGNQAAAFVKLLLEASAQNEIPIYVVLTMRSDYLGECAKFWGLPEAINKGQYLIPRLTRDQRREAIKGPVGLRGAKITARLVTQLLNDMGDDPDQLPILQHALMRTWDRWEQDHKENEPIDLDHYNAIGRMAEALSIHADEAYAELPDEHSREIAKKMFKCLTERGTGHLETRRPTTVSEILAITGADAKELDSVINVFRKEDRSFLLPSAKKPLKGETSIDISHESLIRNWKRLKKWVNREAESANVYKRLVQTATLYKQGQAGMLTDLEIEHALQWKKDNQPNLAWGSRYCLDLVQASKANPEMSNGQPLGVTDQTIFEGAMGFLEQSQAASKRKARIRKLTKILVAASAVLIVAIMLLLIQLSIMKQQGLVKAGLAYSAEIKLAQRELGDGNFAEVNRLLHDSKTHQAQPAFLSLVSWERFFAPPDETSLHGFEWNHIWKRSHNESSTVGQYNSSIISVARFGGSASFGIVERNGQIRIWDSTRGGLTLEPQGAPKDLSFVTFASDGKTVVIARQDGSIALWELSADLKRLTVKRELRSAQEPPVNSLAYSPDNRYVAAGTQYVVPETQELDTSRPHQLRFTIWSVDSNETPYTLLLDSSNKSDPVSLTFSSDSRWLAIGHNQSAKIIDVGSRQEININLGMIPIKNRHSSQPAQPLPISCLAFSPDRQTLAMGRPDGSITIWDLSQNRYLVSLKGHTSEVLKLVFSDEITGVLASGSRDGGIRIWNARKFSDPNYVQELISRSDPNYVRELIAREGVGHMKLRERLRNELEKTTLYGHAGPVTALAFMPDYKTIVSGSEDKSVKLWSIDTRPNATLMIGTPSSASISSLAFSSNSGWLAAGRYDGSAVVWNTSQKQQDGSVLVQPSSPPANAVTPVAISRDDVLAVATRDFTVTLWQMNNLSAELRTLSGGHTRPVSALAFSPDGKWLATGGGDKTVQLWEVATGTRHKVTVLKEGDAVLSLAFAPNQSILAIGTNKSTVLLWDLNRNKEAGELNGHADAVSSIVFSADSRIIATGSWDTTAKLWDARTRKLSATLQGHSQKVLSVSFFPDDKRLATAGGEGSVKLWDTSDASGDEQTRNELVTLLDENLKPGFAVMVSPDGRILATGNADGTVLLRYAANKEEIAKQTEAPK